MTADDLAPQRNLAVVEYLEPVPARITVPTTHKSYSHKAFQFPVLSKVAKNPFVGNTPDQKNAHHL